jgi:hypothetical protein
MNMRTLLIYGWTALIVMLCGCASNVTPGDRDYPTANPNPSKVLEVHGRIEPSVPVRFFAYWIATRAKSYPVADGNCNYTFNWLEGVGDRYSVAVPVAITSKADSYVLSMNTDAFLPGRCGWKFSGLLVALDKQVFDNGFSVDEAELVVLYNPSLPNWAGMLKSTDSHLDVACTPRSYNSSQAPHDGVYMKCVDTASGKKIRALVSDKDSGAFELNINNSQRP